MAYVFKEVIIVYLENYRKYLNKLCKLDAVLNSEAKGIYELRGYCGPVMNTSRTLNSFIHKAADR
jgi:hypothetical protein